MAAGEGWNDSPRRWHVVLATVVPFVVLASECAAVTPGTATLVVQGVGSRQSKLVNLQPGTLIGDKPPTGWSHMVVKSIPRLSSGDRGTLPAGSSKTATLFRTVILADVKPVDVDEKDFELVRIGVGICVPHDEDHDMVVAADRLDALGLKLTTVQRLVLDAAEAELAEGRIIASTPTFAWFRSPGILVGPGNEHREVNLCYAFCVERTTGKLQVGAWAMPRDTKRPAPPTALVRLGPKPVYDCQIDVKAKRILGMVPYSWSFALRSLPPGKPVQVSTELGDLIAVTNRHPDQGDLEELERLLDKFLFASSDSDTAIRRTTIPPPPYRQSR
jgi:hypothetical protein